VSVSGGGVSSMGELNVERSTFFNNTAQSGGAIFAGAGILNLTNSTVTTNHASMDAAGVLISGLVDADIVHCTVAYNRATQPGGGVVAGGGVTFQNTILAHNRSTDCNNFSISGGSVSFEGENLDTDSSCDGFTFSSYDPQLESLADNGGYTQTHALHGGSIAIDRTDECGGIGEDQRMVSRPQGAACDLGAYERDLPEPAPPPPPGSFLLQTTTNVNCRIGPHPDHAVVITFTTGHTATAIGRNEDGSWFAVAAPQELEETDEPWCWLPDAFVQREFNPNDLPELDHLPPPNVLEPRPPTKEPGEPGCTGGSSACP
jgi:predicted outer membrane repeat protein